MIFKKNIHFTKLIKVNGRAREFNFRKKYLSEVAIYDIDVSDEKGDRHYISMRQDKGIWTIQENNIHAWLKDTHPDLNAAIKERENEN
jgi:hypothetical protein